MGREIESTDAMSGLARAIEYLSTIEDSYTPESDRFLDYLWANGLSPASIKQYVADLETLEVEDGNRLISAETYNKHVKAVKNRIRILAKQSHFHLTPEQQFKIEETLKAIPLKRIQHHGKEEAELPSREEMKLLLAQAPKRLSLIMEFLLYSGARISEALNVRMGDIQKYRGHVTVTLRGKRNKERLTFVPRDLFDRILREFDQHERRYLFQHSQRQYNRKSIANEVKRQSYKIIGKDISPHDIRHRLGSDMTLEYGLWAASDYLGHASIAVTQQFYNSNRVSAKHIKDLYRR